MSDDEYTDEGMSKEDLILVIDDDHDDQYIIGELLKESGFAEFEFRSNGEEALKYLDRKIEDAELPGLILLDLNMPVLDGKVLLKLLKSNERYRAIPIIIYSADSMPKEINECLSLGATSYMVKPMTLRNTRDLIDEIEKNFFTPAKNQAG